MPRNSGVSKVRATAFRSISGRVVPPAGSLVSPESRSRLSQRMTGSLEPAFDLGKHVFGSSVGSLWRRLPFTSAGARSVIGSYRFQKESGTKTERLDKPDPVGD